MSNETSTPGLSIRAALEAEKKRLLEQAAAVERDLAEIERLTAKYNLVVARANGSAPPGMVVLPPSANTTVIETTQPAVRRQSYDGTVAGLIDVYKNSDQSTYRDLQFQTKETYDGMFRRLAIGIGDERIADFMPQRIQSLYDGRTNDGGKLALGTPWSASSGRRGLGVMKLDDPDCTRLSTILNKMHFKQPARRREQLTAEMANGIRAKAHEIGRPSLALAQALQYELKLTQKETIGEWVPLDYPGESELEYKGRKWLPGAAVVLSRRQPHLASAWLARGRPQNVADERRGDPARHQPLPTTPAAGRPGWWRRSWAGRPGWAPSIADGGAGLPTTLGCRGQSRTWTRGRRRGCSAAWSHSNTAGRSPPHSLG